MRVEAAAAQIDPADEGRGVVYDDKLLVVRPRLAYASPVEQLRRAVPQHVDVFVQPPEVSLSLHTTQQKSVAYIHTCMQMRTMYTTNKRCNARRQSVHEARLLSAQKKAGRTDVQPHNQPCIHPCQGNRTYAYRASHRIANPVVRTCSL